MTDVLTKAWADEVAAAIQQGPPDAYKATKLEKYWGWVEMTGLAFKGTVAVGVSDPPASADGGWLLIDLADAGCTRARIGTDADAAEADFRMLGTTADLQDLLDGYDVGKAIMYRKLRLLEAPPEKIHEFFRAIFFLKETLGCIANVGRSEAVPA